jgi:DNA repair protein RecO (recombination protein O)
LLCLYGGYYIAELLSELTEEDDPHPSLFDEALKALQLLAQGEHASQGIIRFELAILREIGQLPAFDVCISCGNPVTNTAPYGFWVSQGGLICSNCKKEAYDQKLIQPGTIRLLRALSEGDAAADRVVVSPAQIKEMRNVTNAAVAHVLGHRPKMFRYIQ